MSNFITRPMQKPYIALLVSLKRPKSVSFGLCLHIYINIIIMCRVVGLVGCHFSGWFVGVSVLQVHLPVLVRLGSRFSVLMVDDGDDDDVSNICRGCHACSMCFILLAVLILCLNSLSGLWLVLRSSFFFSRTRCFSMRFYLLLLWRVTLVVISSMDKRHS